MPGSAKPRTVIGPSCDDGDVSFDAVTDVSVIDLEDLLSFCCLVKVIGRLLVVLSLDSATPLEARTEMMMALMSMPLLTLASIRYH